MSQHLHATGFAAKALSASDDQRLGQLIATGHDSAYTELISRHQPVLRQYARKLLRDRQAADNVTNAALVECVKAYRIGQAPQNPGQWLADKVHLSVLDHLDRLATSSTDPADGPPPLLTPDMRLPAVLETLRSASPAVRARALSAHLSRMTSEDVFAELDIASAPNGSLLGRLIPLSLVERLLEKQPGEPAESPSGPQLRDRNPLNRVAQWPTSAKAAAAAGAAIILLAGGYAAFGSGSDDDRPVAQHTQTQAQTPVNPVQTTPQTQTQTVPEPDVDPRLVDPRPQRRSSRPRTPPLTEPRAAQRRARTPAPPATRLPSVTQRRAAPSESASGQIINVDRSSGRIVLRSGGESLVFRASSAQLQAADGCSIARIIFRRAQGGLLAQQVQCVTRRTTPTPDPKPKPTPKPPAPRKQPKMMRASGEVQRWVNLDITLRVNGQSRQFRIDETMLNTIDGCQRAQVTWPQTDQERPVVSTLRCLRRYPAVVQQRQQTEPVEITPEPAPAPAVSAGQTEPVS
jgi:DNA-directed RNA polymerase specialized sigma24 family protein